MGAYGGCADWNAFTVTTFKCVDLWLYVSGMIGECVGVEKNISKYKDKNQLYQI